MAAMDDVDAAVGRDLDGGYRSPGHAIRRVRPVADGVAIAAVGQIVEGRNVSRRGKREGDEDSGGGERLIHRPGRC